VTDRPPRRARVLLADRRPAPMPVRRGVEVAEQTEIGRELVRGRVRAQLGRRLRIVGVGLLLFAPLPIPFALPAVQDLRILGVPLAWWVLGVAVYPVVYLLVRWHRRQAERIERDFTDLLGRG
jgi:hypothetical protein